MSVRSLTEAGRGVLDRVKIALPQADAEVFLLNSESRVTEWSEGQPENQVIAHSTGLGLRLVQDGHLGFGYTNRLNKDDTEILVQQAIAASHSTVADPYLSVPSPVTDSSSNGLDLVDSTLTQTHWESRCEFLPGLEASVKQRSPRISKVLRGSYREGHGQVTVMNSKGVQASYEGTTVSVSVVCVAVEAGETQIGYAFQAARHYADLKIDWVIDKAVEHTLSLLGGKRIASGVYDLVLDPFVAGEMLELFAGALQADRVQKGKSFLAHKVGETIGSTCLTLLDHGRLPRGLGTAPVDAEGMPTQKTVLMDRGRLRGFLYDSYTARKAKTPSTGNAGRSSYKGLPGPEATNFYLESGTQSPEALLSQVRKGIYVRSVMGLHTVDTISGDYSLGLMGEFIENGQRVHGVRGVTMAGNMLELLKNVVAVGSDLVFSGSVGSPTLWIKDVSIGGIS